METIINPEKSQWADLLKRPLFSVAELTQRVQAVLDEIRTGGMDAIRK